MYLLPQVWNKIIADNQHNVGKLGRVKVHSHVWQSMDWGDCNVYPLFVVNAPIIRMVCNKIKQHFANKQLNN